LGAQATEAEVLVFLNNDACLGDPDTLGEICSWALEPDVATVGVRIETPSGRQLSAGLRLRLRVTVHESLAEDDASPQFARCVRETAGNTFACAALEREKARTLGWLDSARFPNGFNDVEFCLRARQAGYTHVCLGHRSAVHDVHATRRRTDESAQKLLLRELYPDTMKWAMRQLLVEYRKEQLRKSEIPRALVGRLLRRIGLKSDRD
jgi:GT2 family glycosyltransferase